MRVLIVSHLALPHVGGVEVLVDREIRALAEAGHEVTLITSDGTGQAQSPAYSPAVRIERVRAWHVLERHFRLPFPIFSPWLLAALWRASGAADVIHIHGCMFLSSLAAALIGRLRGRPIILTDHGGIQQFDARWKSILARLGAETAGRITACCADRLVAYNTRITRLLEQLTGRAGRAMFLPNPVDRSLFRPVDDACRQELRSRLGWTDGRPRVLFVGRLTTEKGVPLLLECMDPSRYDLVFCGAGDSGLLGPLPRAGVEYRPPRPQRELAALYQAADLLVVPSKVREGFPLVVQEGLACGLKVVLGDDPGFAPYRRLTGLQLCQATVADVRRAIVAALENPADFRPAAELAEFCPSAERWIERMYGDHARRSGPSRLAAAQTACP
ncbi:MAG TPA: glycosyltransferase family 4 protein [Pirellulaceae bacterium]|nr:glycosyltransferase family 4 protein [Pirellulaceae bacterium]